MASSCLHYGQEAFEGLKAYRGKEGSIRLFRVDENAKRMQRSAEYLKMAVPSIELFTECVKMVVKANERFIPPYGTGASFYIRPLLIGVGPQVGVKPSKDYLLVMFAMPVGLYFTSGFKTMDVVIDRRHDRAAPMGTGHIKAGGNYGASMLSAVEGHDQGYASVLYLDSKEKKYIDECGAANFFGIKGNSYVTPESHSILPSITNMSLRQLAEDLGLKVENRHIPVEELADFDEAGACGTAAIISPIGSVYDSDNHITYTLGDGKTVGKWCTMLYDMLTGIQHGDIDDKHGWVTIM
jgi:branched-chain amino acid aminotransferase